MSAKLPIINSDRPCLVDPEYAIWFQNKQLILDDIGVFYIKDSRKFYVHDQVIILATKDGLKEPPADKNFLRQFIKAKCDTDVQEYYHRRNI